MRVLLLVEDLFRTRGGGQTFYQRLVRAHPEIEFVYYRRVEAADAKRPANAKTVPIDALLSLQVTRPGIFPTYRNRELALALSYAGPVAGEAFDIVDYPDFYTFGVYLRDAFAFHNVRYGAIVLSMHGNISNTIEYAWGSPGDNTLQQRQLEAEQFRDADGRYAISPKYREIWQSRIDAPVDLIDPLSVIDFSPHIAPRGAPRSKPDLLFVGRRERLKGPDLFIEIGAWLERSHFNDLVAIGDAVPTESGGTADDILARLAQLRGVSCRLEASRPPAELRKLYQNDSVVVLPTRFDTFNLVALEAMAEGCPVAISTTAGACDYLDTVHPDIPYLKMNFEDWPRSITALDSWLLDYADRRARAEAAAWALRSRQRPFDIRSVYASVLVNKSCTPAFTPKLLWTQVRVDREPLSHSGLLSLKAWARKQRLAPIARPLYASFLQCISTLRRIALPKESLISERMRRISEYPERNLAQVGEKLDVLYQFADRPFFRCNLWQEIARLERLRGNLLIAATYEMRLLRLVGEDRWGYLPGIRSALAGCDKDAVAEVLEAQYGPDSSPAAVHALLEKRARQLRKNSVTPNGDCAMVDDRRSGSSPLVTIIVSLYNAASKVPFFLQMLERQTLVQSGECEVVFVDAASPTDERSAIEVSINTLKNSYLFVRTAKRESIQAAWNRALGFARGKYITCLGVDEGLYPEALACLAAVLEADKSVDWAVSNAIVTRVDKNGVYVDDVMVYRRDLACKEWTYLDTTYVGWVGGLYRRDIHERFGYYDSDFRAAGDTEFKMRTFRNLNVKFLDRTLGVFFDYPEARTTASAIAEVEDMLAWYAYRTEGGVNYLFDGRDPDRALGLLGDCAAYRKAYLSYTSTDVELGRNLGQMLVAKFPNDKATRTLAEDFQVMLGDLRRIEYADGLDAARKSELTVSQIRRRWATFESQHRAIMTQNRSLVYNLTNDNRYEQHSWLWKT